MRQKAKKKDVRQQPVKNVRRKNRRKGRESLDTDTDFELKDHEHPSKTLTPKRHHHPLSWWLKWISSIILIVAMIATTNNMYPWNMFLQFLGVAGWLWVAVIWNDRALIVVNAVAVAIFLNGIFVYFKG